ncbi:hypothetical protein GO308_01005 [Sphingomonas sp. SFZ2018-12]|uniref:hypothetical protein n=1 Tax=Sphingomonas sp. SFZ2018-12 TaxID=2683197 RepID=UPI001F0F07BB|nr:hypothetical protein [Sphingomonas sp. SFZ2018-12]MCH4891685.1 hypothetical protein [Sphingomonas sp. SFZ2018-12]
MFSARTSRFGLRSAGVAAAFLTFATLPVQAGEQAAGDARQELVEEILVLARSLPVDTPARVFEARFAQVVDARRDQCDLVLGALLDARGRVQVPAASAALRDLYSVLRGCSVGTGATATGSSGLAPIPSFSVGGGSDYRD